MDEENDDDEECDVSPFRWLKIRFLKTRQFFDCIDYVFCDDKDEEDRRFSIYMKRR